MTDQDAGHLSQEDRAHTRLAQLARREPEGIVRRGPVHWVQAL